MRLRRRNRLRDPDGRPLMELSIGRAEQSGKPIVVLTFPEGIVPTANEYQFAHDWLATAGTYTHLAEVRER